MLRRQSVGRFWEAALSTSPKAVTLSLSKGLCRAVVSAL
jgi:hypothetical protein